MRSRNSLILIIVLAAVGTYMTVHHEAEAAPAKAWEYKLVEVGILSTGVNPNTTTVRDLPSDAQKLLAEGWEVFSSNGISFGGTTSAWYITLRRQPK